LVLIRDSIEHIQHYLPESESAFLSQTITQDAILMRLQIIGENLATARRIDEEAFTSSDNGTWNKLIGLRNIISHGYQFIELERIWEFVSRDLPEFSLSIDRAIQQQS
jgi:uncharacterized protein with HEPN domain